MGLEVTTGESRRGPKPNPKAYHLRVDQRRSRPKKKKKVTSEIERKPSERDARKLGEGNVSRTKCVLLYHLPLIRRRRKGVILEEVISELAT